MDAPKPSLGEFRYTVVEGPAAAWGVEGREHGCEGMIWLPERNEYGWIALEIYLPERHITAANGATYERLLVAREGPRPEDRALVRMKCRLPDTGEQEESAHRYVMRLVLAEVETLRRAASGGVPYGADLYSELTGGGADPCLVVETREGPRLADTLRLARFGSDKAPRYSPTATDRGLAIGKKWFRENQAISVGGKQYVKHGLPLRALPAGSDRLATPFRHAGTHDGVPLYEEVGEGQGSRVLAVKMNSDCHFQPYADPSVVR